MLLDQLQPVLLGEQHEPVHRPLGLRLRPRLLVGRRLLLLQLGRRHGRAHDQALPPSGSDRQRALLHRRRRLGRGGCGSGCGGGGVELESAEAVAEVGGPDGLGVVGREADVAHGEILAGDSILLDGQAGLGRAPTWKAECRRKKGLIKLFQQSFMSADT